MTVKLNRFAPVSVVQMSDVLYLGNGIDSVYMTDGKQTGGVIYTMSTTAPAVGTFAGVAGIAGNLNGSYKYVVSYIRALGSSYPFMESGVCTEINVAGIVNQKVELSNIPKSSDTQVTGRRIYRHGGTLNAFYLVATIADNTTETYSDNIADSTVKAQERLRETADAFPLRRTYAEGLPPAMEYLEVYDLRIWGVKDDTLYWSEPKPYHEDWPSRNSEHIPMREGISEKATGLREFQGRLYVWREDQVFLVEKDALVYRLTPVVPNRGTPGGHTIVPVGDVCFWLDRQVGPVMWAGAGEPIPIGVPIQELWGRVEKNALWRAFGAFYPEKHLVVWSVQEGRYDRNNRLLAYDILGRQWYWHVCEATALGRVRNEVGKEAVLMGTSLGDVYQFDLGRGDGAGSAGTVTGPVGTLSASGCLLTDSGAAFSTETDEIEGSAIHLYDTGKVWLQTNRIAKVDSATALRLLYPMPSGVLYYRITGVPMIWESGWIKVAEEQALMWVRLEYEPDATNGGVVYVDYKGLADSAYVNAGSVDTTGSGTDDVRVAYRASAHKVRLRFFDTGKDFKLSGLVLSILPYGGKE